MQTAERVGSQTRINKKRKKNKERKGENRKRAGEWNLCLGYRTNTTLCTNSGKFWVAPGVTLRRCPVRGAVHRHCWKLQQGIASNFSEMHFTGGYQHVGFALEMPLGQAVLPPFPGYFGSKIKCLFILLKWVLIEGAALLEVHQTNVAWCFSFPNPKGTCP